MQTNQEHVKEIQAIFNNAPYPNHMVMQLKDMDIHQTDIEINLGKKVLKQLWSS